MIALAADYSDIGQSRFAAIAIKRHYIEGLSNSCCVAGGTGDVKVEARLAAHIDRSRMRGYSRTVQVILLMPGETVR